jgi:CelD/BcsL family acetyltransferase involved in cellulose biosynthesis
MALSVAVKEPVGGGRRASGEGDCSSAETVPFSERVSIETITDYEAFLALEPVWSDVAEAAGLHHPFLEFAWVRTWWESFGAGSTLHVLVIRAGDRPIGIAPLMVTTIRMWGIKVRRLGFLYNSHVPCADFLIARQPKEVYAAIWAHLSQNRCWDVLQLCQLAEGSATLEDVPKLAAAAGCRVGVWASDASPYLPLRPSWDSYFDSLTAKHRSNLRNRFKRMKATGPVEIETITSAEGLAEGLESGLRLEAAGWKGEAHTAISCDPAVSRFYSILARRAAEQGWICLHFLKAGPTRVAFDYSLSYKNRLYLLKVGYDPAHAPFSPSNLLLCLVLQNAFEQGVTEYEFLGSEADWKLAWAKQVRRYYWLFVFAGTFKGRFLYLIKFQLIPFLTRPGLRRVRRLIERVSTHRPFWGVWREN